MLNFLRRSLPLVLMGIALGMLARFIFGGPESENANTREFQQPIDERLKAEVLAEEPDLPIDDDLRFDD